MQNGWETKRTYIVDIVLLHANNRDYTRSRREKKNFECTCVWLGPWLWFNWPGNFFRWIKYYKTILHISSHFCVQSRRFSYLFHAHCFPAFIVFLCVSWPVFVFSLMRFHWWLFQCLILFTSEIPITVHKFPTIWMLILSIFCCISPAISGNTKRKHWTMFDVVSDYPWRHFYCMQQVLSFGYLLKYNKIW